MSPLRAALQCLLAVTILQVILTTEVSSLPNAAEHHASSEKVKRGAMGPIQVTNFRTIPSDRFEIVLFLNDISTGITLNHPNFERIVLEEGESISYQAPIVVVVFTGGNSTTASEISRFSFVDRNGIYRDVNDMEMLSGAGNLFLQRPTALFVQNTQLSNFVLGILAGDLPDIIDVRFAEVMVVERITPADNIVVNIDSAVEDGLANPADDIIELTGSTTFIISDRQDIVYDGDTIISFSGNVLGPDFGMNIANFYYLEPSFTPGSSIIGRSFEIFNNSNPPQRAFTGPGVLRVGKNAGQNVAFYSTVPDVNQLISTELVSRSLMFEGSNGMATITARFPPSLRGMQLISLAAAESFSYPTATSVRTSGSVVEVLSGQQIIQRFDLGQPPTFSSFINHEVRRVMTDEMYDIPDGGATLWINPMQNTYFLYPSRNQVIGSSITTAISNANIEQVIRSAEFRLRSDEVGVVTLSLVTTDDQSETFEIQVRPSTVFDVPRGQSLSYKGRTLELVGAGGETRRVFDGMISPFIVNQQGSDILSSEDTFFATFGGPGRLYIDEMRNAFYTSNTDVQNFITNFIASVPQPTVNLVRERDSNDIFFRTGDRDWLRLNGGSTMTNQRAAVYFNNEINFVDVFNIPNNARARYDLARSVVEVRDPNDPSRVLFVSAMLPSNGVYEYNDSPSFVGTTPDTDLLVLNSDFDFSFTNGIIYHSGTGVVVSSSDFMNMRIYDALFASGGIGASVETIPNVANLTVASGESIVTYSGGVPFLLPRGGTYYFSQEMPSNGIIFDTNSYRSFLRGVSGTYAQLNPSSVSYNRTSRVLSLLTGENQTVGSLVVGETMLTTINRGFSFLYENETIFFDDGTNRTGINELLIWDGFQTRVIDRTIQGPQTFFGPGLFWFIEPDRAFFTTDANSVRRVQDLARSVRGTFRIPIIGRETQTFRSKFRNVVGGFPQSITVYQGANLRLRCNVVATNPAATITFFERFFNQSGQDSPVDEPVLEGDMGFMIVRVSMNSSDLIVRNLDLPQAGEPNRVFGCMASNLMGSQSLATVVTVLPPQPPAIVNNFVAPLSFFTESSDRFATITAGDVNDMLPLNRDRFFTIVSPDPPAGVVFVDDGFTVVRRVHIGCKAEGLPKSEITWFRLPVDSSETDLGSVNREFINESTPNISVSVPREGRSVLTVELDQARPGCTRYICRAENAAGVVLGGTDICTQSFSCDSIRENGMCSVTCGLGIASQRYVNCAVSQSGILVEIPYENIPGGLFPLSPTFCPEMDEQVPCPVVTFSYVRVNSSNCSVTCGCGVITSEVVCQRNVTIGGMLNETEIVADSFCVGQQRISDQVPCFNPPCPSVDVGPFDTCSATCRGGTRSRNVTCIRPEFDMNSDEFENILDADGDVTYMVVDDAICIDEGVRIPDRIVACNDHIDCPFRYKVGEWGPCDEVFDNCQVRERLCENFDPRDYYWPGECVNISICESMNLSRPHIIRSCGGGLCRPGIWMTATNINYPCSVTCGRGLQRVDVFCVNATTGIQEIDPDFCAAQQRPSDIQTCVLNCRDRCFFEPSICPTIRLVGCDRENLREVAEQCCRSCPKIATPITDPMTLPGGVVTAEN